MKLICSCCGEYTVEQVCATVPKYGNRYRLRIKHGPWLLGDFSNLAEVEIVLKRHGVFEYLVPADEPDR